MLQGKISRPSAFWMISTLQLLRFSPYLVLSRVLKVDDRSKLNNLETDFLFPGPALNTFAPTCFDFFSSSCLCSCFVSRVSTKILSNQAVSCNQTSVRFFLNLLWVFGIWSNL